MNRKYFISFAAYDSDNNIIKVGQSIHSFNRKLKKWDDFLEIAKSIKAYHNVDEQYFIHITNISYLGRGNGF